MARSRLLLPYCLCNEILTHVDAVPRGLECNCLCPACSKPVVAKQGDCRQHHFAHSANNGECTGATRLALILAIKQILEHRLELVLPPAPAPVAVRQSPYQIENVALSETAENGFPLLLVIIGSKQLRIELRLNRNVESKKLDLIRQTGISTIEIALWHHRRNLSPVVLEQLIVEGGLHKSWIHNCQ